MGWFDHLSDVCYKLFPRCSESLCEGKVVHWWCFQSGRDGKCHFLHGPWEPGAELMRSMVSFIKRVLDCAIMVCLMYDISHLLSAFSLTVWTAKGWTGMLLRGVPTDPAGFPAPAVTELVKILHLLMFSGSFGEFTRSLCLLGVFYYFGGDSVCHLYLAYFRDKTFRTSMEERGNLGQLKLFLLKYMQ